jgi:hypothetical protein
MFDNLRRRALHIGVFAPLLLAACTINGVRNEDGTYNLGPSVFGDDPVGHKTYPSYAEYAVATHELDKMKDDGYSDEQQLCFARAAIGGLPSDLRTRLDDYAANKTTLMESQYAALQKEAEGYFTDEAFLRRLKPELDRCRV